MKLKNIEEREDRFIVRSIRWLALPGTTTLQAVQQPVHYVSMKRSDKPVEFAETVQAYENSL